MQLKKNKHTSMKGFSSFNVWPPDSTPAKVEIVQLEKPTLARVDDDEKNENVGDAIALALKPFLEALSSSQKPHVSAETTKESSFLQKHHFLIIIILIVLVFISFLSAVWSASSVDKLLRLIYKLKQAKP